MGSRARQRFLKVYTKSTMNKGKTGKFDFIQTKILCPLKAFLKDKLQIGRKYLQTTYLTKDLYPEYIKNLQNTARYGKTGSFIHCWWEGTIIQALWNIVWQHQAAHWRRCPQSISEPHLPTAVQSRNLSSFSDPPLL